MTSLNRPHRSRDARWGDLASNGRIYDFVQRIVGRGETSRRLRHELEMLQPRTIVDVGAGTGNRVPQLPPGARYVWVDIDPAKLRRFREKWPEHGAILSDALAIGIGDGASDCTLCVAVTHHLPAAALSRAFAEMARITRGHLLFVDAVQEPAAWASRLLWRLDRGAFPHRAETLLRAMSHSFRIEHHERYARYHHYLLCRATPRPPVGAAPVASTPVPGLPRSSS